MYAAFPGVENGASNREYSRKMPPAVKHKQLDKYDNECPKAARDSAHAYNFVFV